MPSFLCLSHSLSRSSSQKTTSAWKTWPGIGSTSSVRAVSSCWAAVHTLSPRASSCAPLVASPNAPEVLPTHCQSPLDPTRRLKPSVLWGEHKSQQAVHILGWVVVDPWGSIVLKPERFWEVLEWIYCFPTEANKRHTGILQGNPRRNFPECISEGSNEVAVGCAFFLWTRDLSRGQDGISTLICLPLFQVESESSINNAVGMITI